MRLITTILPRRDGTVIAKSPDGKRTFTFTADAGGELTCEVDDDETVAHLLRTDSFYPADEADFSLAMQLADDGSGEDGAEGDEGPADDDTGDADEGSVDGAPVESETPAVVATPAAVARKAKRADLS